MTFVKICSLVNVIENLSGDLIDASIDYKLFVNKRKLERLELCYMSKFARTADFFSTVVNRPVRFNAYMGIKMQISFFRSQISQKAK